MKETGNEQLKMELCENLGFIQMRLRRASGLAKEARLKKMQAEIDKMAEKSVRMYNAIYQETKICGMLIGRKHD